MSQSDPILSALLQAIDEGNPVALMTVIKATGVFSASLGKHQLIWLDRPPLGYLAIGKLQEKALAEGRKALSQRRPQTIDLEAEDDRVTLFIEVQRKPLKLIIVGAGHIALPLAQLGKMIDFDVTVLDDRPQFANPQRFPMADTVIADDLQKTLHQMVIDHDSYIVLVTRGHSHDVECLLEVLDSPAAYIDMIGSKRRIRAVFELLENEKGIPREKFSRVYAPIGLDLGAETPAEIAIAIIAEIINIFRGGRAESLADTLRADKKAALHPDRLSPHSP